MSNRGETPTVAAEAKATRTPVTSPFDQPAIELVNVARRDPKAENWLIRDVCCTIHFGDRLGVFGPSGAGKTVLLRALAMLDPLDAGEIRWKGQTVRGEAVPLYRRHVVYLHQRPALAEGSVEESLRAPFTLKAHRERLFGRGPVVELLAALGRDGAFLDKSCRDLSGGEAQIVALVRAVQLEPAVLLLDEPTASLDPATAQAVEDLLGRWLLARASERALVWVSHDRDQALRMTGRRISLRSGRLEPEA
jgi:UDP-glucose/iron transport system ATP-binding protein